MGCACAPPATVTCALESSAMGGIISAVLRAPSQGLAHGSSSIRICGDISGCVNDVN